MDKRFDMAVEAAKERFWVEMARRYPEVKTGDIPPEAMVKFDEACDETAKTWLLYNK